MSTILRRLRPLLPVGACLLAGWLGLLVGGCSPHKNDAPPADQVRAALTATLPPYLAVDAVETEAIPTAADQAKVNAKVTVTPKETLYVNDRRIPGDPSILLIKPAQAAGAKVTLYGSLQAQRTLDRWTLTPAEFSSGLNGFGQPRSAFGIQCFVAGSPEAAAATKALQEHADELERQAQARQEKERQAKQAQVEQAQREAQAAEERLLRATAPGSRYLGTVTNPTTSHSQRLRLAFTEQRGTLLRAEATDPDRPADHRPLAGELVPRRADVSTDAPDDPTDQKTYPIQLTATADGKQETVNGRGSLYWGQSGPVRLRPNDQGGLEGEAVVFGRLVIRLQREP